jgi:hypothetical protein
MPSTAGSMLNDNIFGDLFKGGLTAYRLEDPPALFGSDPLLAIWHAGSGNGTLEDFSGLIKNISDTVTMRVREHGNVYQSKPALGEVHYNTVCISVQWPWIAYSGAIVVLTLLFFALVVLQTGRDQSRLLEMWKSGDAPATLHDFKSSPLIVLFHGLDETSQRELAHIGRTNHQKEMEQVSKQTKVQLVATEQGWKLSTS